MGRLSETLETFKYPIAEGVRNSVGWGRKGESQEQVRKLGNFYVLVRSLILYMEHWN